MHTFTSVNNKLTLLGKTIGVGKEQELEYKVNFQPVGAMGRFITEDEELAKKLREHPSFGKMFMEIGLTAKENPHIVEGIRNSESHPKLGEDKVFDPEKLIKFGRLQATLLKNDGTYRKDASQENIEEYEKLKLELEK
jgi:hypothetical protein